MLGERRSEVLRALVEEHIRTHEPVSSRAILAVTGLDVSSATIRSDLAALEREGYVAQPHTSAGRVPTAQGYRYYVDHLTPPLLRETAERRISAFFSSMQVQADRLLRATTELLSDITSYPSVVMGPGPGGERIKALHLVQLDPTSVLLVVVTESGRVCQEWLRLPEETGPQAIGDAEQVLVRVLTGQVLAAAGIRPGLVGDLEPSVAGLVRHALAGVERAASDSSDVFVGGTQRMASVWEDLQTVRQVLEMLEREALLREILARSAGTTIRIGGELGLPAGFDLAVVSTSFPGSGSQGRVGVIGPMRMDYRKAISAVESVGRELGDRIGS